MDEARAMALRLARAGFMNGNPSAVEEMPADMAIDMYHYLGFERDFSNALAKMNAPAK